MERKNKSNKVKNQKTQQGLLKKAERIQKENSAVKVKTPFLTKIIVRIIAIILLLLGFTLGIKIAVNKITQVTLDGRHALVDKQLSYCQELVTVKYRYSDIVTLKKSSGFAKSYSIVKFSGVLRAGIADITDIDFNISKNGKVITIKLPEAEVLGNELVKQEVFDEKQSIFVPITTQEIFNEIEEARIQIAEDMIAEGVLKEAKEYAKKVLLQTMKTSGFQEVIIR